MTNFVYFIIYVPSNFISIPFLSRFGIKASIIVGTLFVLVGAWIRVFIVFSEDSFVYFFIGSIIAAVG
jgi:fucose permease